MKTKDYFSTTEYLKKLNEYWNAANYLSAAQLYLRDNPLLRDHPLCRADIKQKIVGHWGTVPGQNFVYAHLDRVIKKYDQDIILLSGPGHGGNFFVANSYLEGTYSEYYPNISADHDGMKRLCKQFSFAGGIGSHCTPETPGSINEGGELGYSLAHGYGAIFDNPNLIAAVIVGDGEAETGPLATSWHSNKFVNPKTDGAVLPILHLNGYKINNPTILSRLSSSELKKLFEGYGYTPYFVEGSDASSMHAAMAKTMDICIESIRDIWEQARTSKHFARPSWPMIILRTPKGWTGPKVVDGKKIEGTFRAHQVPLTIDNDEDIAMLEAWLTSYHPEKVFDKDYRLREDLREILPTGDKRISASPYANGGKLLKPLKTPKVEDYEIKIGKRGHHMTQDMLELGGYIRDVFKLNEKNKNYRIFSPDEAMSNRLYRVFDAENRDFNATILPDDDKLARDGRIMDSYLSEHMCEGWLEGYLLTGRHGMFDSYEAFIRVVDSMVTQHAKWLSMCDDIPWRAPISSLNLLLTSNVWQQDHNGFTHQDPGFLDHMVTKYVGGVRMYLPADANTLIAVYDECTKSKNRINIMVASKHPTAQWLSMKEAKALVKAGVGVFKWAGMNDQDDPDLVLVTCGSTPTIEGLATISLLKKYLPRLNVRFVNVVDLLKLSKNYPHSMTDAEYDKIFTTNKPIIFNFHGYGSLIHQLTYNRTNNNIHVVGYREEGAITTPFDMRVRNHVDRFHLVKKCLQYLDMDDMERERICDIMDEKLREHKAYVTEYGVDMPEIENFLWEE